MHSVSGFVIFSLAIASQVAACRIWNSIAKSKLAQTPVPNYKTLKASILMAIGLGLVKYISLFSTEYPEHSHSLATWGFFVAYVCTAAALVHYLAHCLFEKQFGAISWSPRLALVATLLTMNGAMNQILEDLIERLTPYSQIPYQQIISPVQGLMWTYYMLLLYGMFRVYSTHMNYPYLNRLSVPFLGKVRSVHRDVYLLIFIGCHSALLISADTLLLRVEHLLQEGLFSNHMLWNLAWTGGFIVLFTLLASSYSRTIWQLVSMRQTWGNLGYADARTFGNTPDVQSLTGRALELMQSSLFFWRIALSVAEQRPTLADFEQDDKSAFQVTLNAPYAYALPYSKSLAELWKNTVHQEDYARLMEQMALLLSGQIAQVNHVIRVQTEAFGWQIYHCRCRLERVSQFKGMLNCLYGGIENITQQVRENEYLSTASVRQLNALRIIGHDLVTPLSVIQTNSLLLQKIDAQAHPQRNARALERIQAASEEAMQYLRATLQYAQATPSDPNQSIFYDLPQIVGQVVKTQCEKFRFEPESLSVNIEKAPKHIKLNGLLLKTILNNLVSNALKYGQTGEQPAALLIESVLNEANLPTGIRIVVRDYGLGIPEDFLNNQCMRESARGENVQDIPGEGVGLLIVKNAVRAMNGTIYVRSKPELEAGCEVILHIPFCTVPEKQPEVS